MLALVALIMGIAVLILVAELAFCPRGTSDPCGQVTIGMSKWEAGRTNRLTNDVGEIWSIGSKCIESERYFLTFKRSFVLQRIDTITIFVTVDKASFDGMEQVREVAALYDIRLPDLASLPMADTTLTALSMDSSVSFSYRRVAEPLEMTDRIIYGESDMVTFEIVR